MNVYIVNKNGQPSHITLCKREATQHFEDTVEGGDFESITLLTIAGSIDNTDILRRAKPAA